MFRRANGLKVRLVRKREDDLNALALTIPALVQLFTEFTSVNFLLVSILILSGEWRNWQRNFIYHCIKIETKAVLSKTKNNNYLETYHDIADN